MDQRERCQVGWKVYKSESGQYTVCSFAQSVRRCFSWRSKCLVLRAFPSCRFAHGAYCGLLVLGAFEGFPSGTWQKRFCMSVEEQPPYIQRVLDRFSFTIPSSATSPGLRLRRGQGWGETSERQPVSKKLWQLCSQRSSGVGQLRPSLVWFGSDVSLAVESEGFCSQNLSMCIANLKRHLADPWFWRETGRCALPHL